MLSGDDVEAAFIEAAREQDGGPFDWDRVARLLNQRLADKRAIALGNRAFLLAEAR